MPTVIIIMTRGRTVAGSKGFTLAELIVTIAIAAILVSMAAPNFSDVLAEQRVRAAAADLAGDLSYARIEAATRVARVGLAPLANANWAKGWRVFVDSNNDGAFQSSEPLLKANTGISSQAVFCSSLASFSTAVVFRSDGTLVQPGSLATVSTITVTDGSRGAQKARQLEISTTGRVAIVTQGVAPCS